MPAVPLALAEIEERLEEIRYLLNRRSLLSVLAPVVGVILAIAGLLVWSAARATAETFALSLAAALAAAGILLGWAALVLWRRWLSLDETARLADQRGAMQERLVTVLWLSRAGTQPSMAPVLVADTIDRRAAWQAAAIVQKRRPLELLYPLAGALALAASLFFASRLPPEPEPVTTAMAAKAPHPLPQERNALPPPPPPPMPARAGEGQPLLAPPAAGEQEVGQEGSEGSKAGSGMSEQLRGAIRQALARGPQQMDRPRELGRRPPPQGGEEGAEGQARGSSARDSQRRDGGEPGADDQDGKREANAAAPHGDPGGARPGADPAQAKNGAKGAEGRGDKGKDGNDEARGDRPGDEKGGGAAKAAPGEADGKGKDARPGSADQEAADPAPPASAANPPRGAGKAEPAQVGARNAKGEPKTGEGTRQGGAKAVAGPGSDPEGLFAASGAANGQTQQASGEGTFKLTLGSFLADSPSRNEKPNSKDRIPTRGERAPLADPPSLNPNQTADDALRRADIPPEYEDIVRRIYSARPAN